MCVHFIEIQALKNERISGFLKILNMIYHKKDWKNRCLFDLKIQRKSSKKCIFVMKIWKNLKKITHIFILLKSILHLHHGSRIFFFFNSENFKGLYAVTKVKKGNFRDFLSARFFLFIATIFCITKRVTFKQPWFYLSFTFRRFLWLSTR